MVSWAKRESIIFEINGNECSCIPFNDIYHNLAKMTLCSILNVDKYHFKVIQGS